MGAAVSLDSLTAKDLAFVWVAPQADTINGFKFKLTVVTTSGGLGVLRASAQGVNASGLNDGTLKGPTNNAKKDWTPAGGDVGVYSVVFDEPFAVAMGDQVAFVVKPQSGTWSGTELVQAVYRLTGVEVDYGVYPVNNAVKATAGLQQVIVVGSARSYGCCLLSTGNSGNLQSGSTPNEVGTYFVAPSDSTQLDCIGIQVAGNVTANRSMDFFLYSGTTQLASKVFATTNTLVAGAQRTNIYFTGRVALTPGTAYHVSVKATHASGSMTVYNHVWASSADRATYFGGAVAYHAERAGGAWTYDQAKLTCVLPIIANRAASGGGGNVFDGSILR